ncbi:MAG: hypothetical protein ACE5IM_10725, partial [Nitrospinota bacterium]
PLDAIGTPVRFDQPVLPPFRQQVHIQNLHAGSSLLDITLNRHPDDVGINVTRRTGPAKVITVK